MLILSASSCRLLSINTRVSSSYSSSSYSKLASISCSFSVRSTVGKSMCMVLCSSKVRGMDEMVEDKESTVAVIASSSASEKAELGHSRTFLDVRTEEDLLSGIREETEAGRLPVNVARGMEELYQNYRNAGDNVVVISNHQTEADPAVIALLLEATNPYIAENMTYVAGDRVVTDPLCKPFSMGRNLLCVYSKKHMNDVPELVEMKKRANTRSLKEMALLLRGGSKLIWVAPSGGRDRPDHATEQWYPAPFDASSVDNMRRLVEHAGVPGHTYPLAILCHNIMPPPPQVEKEIGERRVISFHGTGLSVAHEIRFHEIAAACEDPEEAKVAYTQALYDSVNQQYKVLNSAIHGKQGLEASIPTVLLSQPLH